MPTGSISFGGDLTQHASLGVKRLVEASWASTTRSSYNTYIKRWMEYCSTNNISYNQATVQQGADYLGHLFYVGEKHGYIAGTRSALSAILPNVDGKTFGNQEVVKKLLKGVYKGRPSFPRYIVIYDANIILQYIRTLPDNADLLLEVLTKKLCTLLCLLSGNRAQVVPALGLNQCYIDPKGDRFVFNIRQIMKTSTPYRHMEPLEFLAFPHEQKLCIVHCLKEYVARITPIRGDDLGENGCSEKPLIVSYVQPFRPVKKVTIARYVKNFIGDAGIDITVFTSHSTRAASTSLGNNLGMSFKDIAKAAGWRQESTFQRFYNKPICSNLGSRLLHGQK